MLHAISMPQLASKSIYVPGSLLVSLTPIKIKSCGQPLRQYSLAEYQMYCLGSDTRCRLGTESGDFRSIYGKSRRSQEGSTVASSMSNTGRPSRTGYTRRHAVHFRASGSALNSSGFLHAGHAKRSSKSWAIMTGRLYPVRAAAGNRSRIVGNLPTPYRSDP
jgi:hypothetical protein